jgi:hypothetical protein
VEDLFVLCWKSAPPTSTKYERLTSGPPLGKLGGKRATRRQIEPELTHSNAPVGTDYSRIDDKWGERDRERDQGEK